MRQRKKGGVLTGGIYAWLVMPLSASSSSSKHCLLAAVGTGKTRRWPELRPQHSTILILAQRKDKIRQSPESAIR
eukprot:9178865-Pyramimonas_sp.AAC.1